MERENRGAEVWSSTKDDKVVPRKDRGETISLNNVLLPEGTKRLFSRKCGELGTSMRARVADLIRRDSRGDDANPEDRAFLAATIVGIQEMLIRQEECGKEIQGTLIALRLVAETTLDLLSEIADTIAEKGE